MIGMKNSMFNVFTTAIREHKIFICILFTALLLRVVSLGSLPMGLSWDEAATAYNGYGIVTVHRDEWLARMPITFKSFGDYKAAVAIYLDAISTKVLGINTFAIRLPMALAGVFTVFMTYWIGLEVFQKKSGALMAAALVAVSPLNIQFSRIAFESGIGVALVSAGVACFLTARKKGWYFLPSAVSFVLAMYTYHSTKISVPLLVVLLSVAYWKSLMYQKKWVVIGALVGLLLILPLARETLFGNAGERFYMTSAIVDHNNLLPFPKVLSTLATNTGAHLSIKFLLLGESTTFRHSTKKFGILSYLEFVLVLIACISVFRKTKNENRQIIWVIIAIFIGLLPAVISNDVPHGNRAHGIIPWVQILGAYGFLQCEGWLLAQKQSKKLLKIFSFGIVGILTGQTLLYSYWYAQTYSTTPAVKDFQYGYQEAVQYARQKESEVDKVLFTSAYGQPYIYILLFKRLTPIQFHQGALANYEIRDLNWQNDRNRTNILIVGTPKEIPADAPNIVKEIRYPGGEVAFRIVEQ